MTLSEMLIRPLGGGGAGGGGTPCGEGTGVVVCVTAVDPPHAQSAMVPLVPFEEVITFAAAADNRCSSHAQPVSGWTADWGLVAKRKVLVDARFEAVCVGCGVASTAVVDGVKICVELTERAWLVVALAVVVVVVCLVLVCEVYVVGCEVDGVGCEVDGVGCNEDGVVGLVAVAPNNEDVAKAGGGLLLVEGVGVLEADDVG
jgi:hypothetical protein